MDEQSPLSNLSTKLDQTVSLDDLAGKVDLSSIDLRKQLLSEVIAHGLLKLFNISVMFTVVLTVFLAGLDHKLILEGKIQAADRLVTEKVLLAVIGASVIQLGAGMAAIVYSLFRRPPATGSDTTDTDAE